MTLIEKIAQMFMCGFQDDDQLNRLLDLQVGGIIYFERNCHDLDQLKSYSRTIQKKLDIPAFISIDQEGGIVTRIKEKPHVPGQMAIGATNNSEYAYYCADVISKSLIKYGINMNLAPVVDINNNPNNPIINVRSYGSDPDLVTEFSSRAIDAYTDNLIIPVVKHFPGHGDTDLDSHLDLPVLNLTKKRLESVELVPYIKLHNKLSAVMVSHIMYKQISDIYPSSMSKEMISILRSDLNYNGLVMTDCMEMDAVFKHFTVEEAAINSVLAGVDILLYSHTYAVQERALKAIYDAVKSKRIPEALIDQAVERIQRYKRKLNEPNKTETMMDNLLPEVRRASITKVKGVHKVISKDQTLLILPAREWLEVYDHNVMFYSLQQENFIEIFKACEQYEHIIVGSYNTHKYPLQIKLINSIPTEKLILVALESPYDIDFVKEIDRYYCIYEYSEEAFKALEKVLFKNQTAIGKLPVVLRRE